MSDRLTLQQAAEEAGFSYRHFHRLVVDKGLIPYSQPHGPRGKIFISRKAIRRLHVGADQSTPPKASRRRTW